MKNWARLQTDSIPLDYTKLEFAEKFHITPDKVSNIPYVWIQRWQLWEKIKSARIAKEKLLITDSSNLSKEEISLLEWLRQDD